MTVAHSHTRVGAGAGRPVLDAKKGAEDVLEENIYSSDDQEPTSKTGKQKKKKKKTSGFFKKPKKPRVETPRKPAVLLLD